MKISRAHWNQILKRTKQANFSFSEAWKCFICGKGFKGSGCPHSIDDNLAILEQAKVRANIL